MDRSLSSQPSQADQRPSTRGADNRRRDARLRVSFMGRAHSSAFRTIRHMTWPPPLIPELVSIAGRSEPAVAGAAEEFGFAEHVTDWRALLADPRIELFDNTGPEQRPYRAEHRRRPSRQARRM